MAIVAQQRRRKDITTKDCKVGYLDEREDREDREDRRDRKGREVG
jgi:hypothetical protein